MAGLIYLQDNMKVIISVLCHWSAAGINSSRIRSLLRLVLLLANFQLPERDNVLQSVPDVLDVLNSRTSFYPPHRDNWLPSDMQNTPDSDGIEQLCNFDINTMTMSSQNNLVEPHLQPLLSPASLRLVDKLVASALESKEADAGLVGDFFAQAMSSRQCTLEVFEKGFMLIADFLDDIAIDAPKAFDYMAIMPRGA
ncbi:hypothetical protein BD769DRAFT_1642295 [Suillus cothurnatus]|nr:hypothetical protein BD769DRAFT_1642295 [Suillus cothurnatus]